MRIKKIKIYGNRNVPFCEVIMNDNKEYYGMIDMKKKKFKFASSYLPLNYSIDIGEKKKIYNLVQEAFGYKN